jgi:hypothetical protein
MALSAPFKSTEVKLKPGPGGKSYSYVSARTVMNRLDTVLGPENWWDEYVMGQHSVLCKLSIRLPDGSIITKQDAGAYAGMSDEGDDDKSGVSDAFKRAAVKHGPGRYLYKDGVATLEQTVDNLAARFAEVPQAAPLPGRPPKDPVRAIRTAKDLFDYMKAEGTAQKRVFGEDVKAWLETHPGYSKRILQWTDAQVAAALPDMLKIVKKFDHVPDDDSSSDRTTIPIQEAAKPPASEPRPAPSTPSPIDIRDDDPHAEIKNQIVDVVANGLYVMYKSKAKATDIQQMIDFYAWEISHPKGDDVVIGNLREWVEPPELGGLLGAILKMAEEERRTAIETNRKSFG